jgi:hypothetical protein
MVLAKAKKSVKNLIIMVSANAEKYAVFNIVKSIKNQ